MDAKTDPKKPRPRRLFSFDSVKSVTSSRRSSAASSDYEGPKGARPLNPFELSNVQEKDEDDPEGTAQYARQIVEQPMTDAQQDDGWRSSPSTDPFADMQSPTKLEPVRPVPLRAMRSFNSEGQPATPSPTRARWENLRQHVLPAHIRSMSPPPRPGSAQSSIHGNLPLRSNTPKPSRLARLGFKQVVEQARDMADDTRKLGEEIMRGCAVARYPEIQKSSKENLNHGSTVNLAGVPAAGSSRMDYLRRPQSVVSLATTAVGTLGSQGPSLRFLYQILVYHSGPEEHSISPHLPYESQILSTLLCPFLTPTKYPGVRLEEETITAMESFELVSRSWTPVDENACVERCMWCCKAASSLSPSVSRTRILGSLWRIVVPGDTNRILLSPQAFRSIANGLLILLVALYRSSSTMNLDYPTTPSKSSGFPFSSANFQQPIHPDIGSLQDIIFQYLSGSLGEIEDDQIEEAYGVEFGIADRRHMPSVRRAIFLDALVNTIDNSGGTGEWLLCNVIEQYWPLRSGALADSWTTLQAAICCRKLNTFCRLSLSLLQPFLSRPSLSPPAMSRAASSSSSSSSLEAVGWQAQNPRLPFEIVDICQSRILSESEALDEGTELTPQIVLETRIRVARLVLEVLCLDGDDASLMTSPKSDVFGGPRIDSASEGTIKLVKWATNLICQWYRAGSGSPWKQVLEKTLQQMIAGDWSALVLILSALLKTIPADLKKVIFLTIVPMLNEKLVQDPPPYPFPSLSAFLTQLSKTLPPVFFKPLFACAASDKEVVVVNHLCTVQVHSKYIADYWVRDVEMLCMALLGDASGGETPGPRGVARLGQLMLLVETIGRMQKIRHGKDPLSNGDGKSGELLRFVNTLESRIWLMIEARERTALLPSSTRMLLCILFREFRLLTRSLKPAPWLTRTLRWFEDFIADEYIGEFEEEVTTAVERIQGLYAAAQAASKQDRDRPTSLLAATASKVANNPTSGKTFDLASTFAENEKLLKSLAKGYSPKAMKLFVALSALIAEEDYLNLGPLLWQHCLFDNVDASSTGSACFLLMQCAEKTPIDLKAIIEVDLQTSDDTTRLEAVRKIAILTNWRFQIITQHFVNDRSHRPFKLARPPLPFIAADMGTSLYVYTEDSDESKESDDVPLELRQRLAELGFAEEDAGVIDPRQEWIKTPMSILPANQLDRMEVGTNDPVFGTPTSPISSPQPSPRKLGMQRDQAQSLQPVEDAAALLRRNSSTGGPLSSVKRRAVFVPQLALIFPRLATLLFDKNVAVAAATRATLMDLMRNDPSLLLRPIYECLAGENKDIQLAITTLTVLLHVRRTLPPPFTHSVFNNLAGLLKLLARNSETMDALHDFSLVVPVMASIATQVSGISIKEIRRSKLEHFVIPSGSLWFTSSAPKGSMFPRHLKPTNDPFEPVPPTLMEITMIRVSQNMFFYSMLKRNYQDVQVIRKNMSRLVLPSLDDYGLVKNLEINDYMPRKHPPSSNRPPNHGTVEILSLMVSRSYILLVAQIFRSMPRHLSDRHELAILVDGLNRALVVHGDDINIVSQVLIGYMVASTRFRRLFTSGGGYSLFMPALVKVYTEKPSHPGIRSAIEYAINRFYALHKDSFLYQAINTIGQLAMVPDIDLEWFSKGVYDLFASLRKGSSTTVDAAGIRNVNKAEEREALIIHTADEKPQTFLAAIRRGESQTSRQMSLQLPDEYESLRLSMDDFVRLFLTVIAHDLSIARAQHFLRLLRILSPHLYNASASTRTVLADGIVALGSILTKVYSKPKGGENMPKSVPEEEDSTFLGPGLSSEINTKEKARAPSDSKIMRLDYLRLVLGLGSAGGQITLTVARHALDVTRSLLKDWDTNTDALATFLGDFVKMLLYREEPTAPKAVVSFLQELSPILHAYLVSVDFTAVFETVLKLTEMSLYANDSMFGEVVVSEIVTAGLAACDVAASENQLMTLQYRPILISLIAEAIFLKDTDVFSEIEKRPPTYQFLAGVVLPLALSMKTEAQVITDGSRTDDHREKLAIAWVRILYYAIKACQKSRRDADGAQSVNRGLGSSFRSKSGDKGRQESFWRSHLPTFMTALQVIKVVIVRGAADISYLPRIGIWERLSSFCSLMFAEGSADFAFKPDISSAAATPTGSPRTSAQFDLSNSGSRLFVSTSSDLSRPASPSSFSERTRVFRRPRIVDYSLWSMLEFVCAYRSPLRMHLKVLMMEKVVNLDQELQKQSSGTGNTSPYPTSPSSRRVSTSVFSKSRQRMSSLMVPSPESSPRLMPSPSNLMPSPSLLEIPSRRAGYQISPVSPQENSGLPKILHLGPASPSTFPPISSPMIGASLSNAGGIRNTRISGDGGESSTVARTTKIQSLKLIHETYRRIRGVQTFMGYDLLLPMPGLATSNSGSATTPGNTEKEEDAALETWTRQQALSAIVKETKDLVEEFEEGFGMDEGSVIVVDSETRTSYSST